MSLNDDLYISPIAADHEPQLALDVGNGNGVSAIEYAKRTILSGDWY